MEIFMRRSLQNEISLMADNKFRVKTMFTYLIGKPGDVLWKVYCLPLAVDVEKMVICPKFCCISNRQSIGNLCMLCDNSVHLQTWGTTEDT